MRSIWTGNVSFGLINIPVKIYSATEEHPINFDMLHKKDLSKVKYAYICSSENKQINYQDIVKGYEFQPGEYVVVEPEDFKSAEKSKTGAIDILQFADNTEIDPIYFEKPYFLEPGKGGDKAYALFRETLRQAKKVAVVKFIFRNREHLGVLKPYKDVIILDQMRFASEIRAFKELNLPNADLVNKKELSISLKLVDQLTSKFNPQEYHDEYTEQLQKVLEDKVKGHKPTKKKEAPKKTSKIHDITALLEASLEEAQHKKNGKTKKKKVV